MQLKDECEPEHLKLFFSAYTSLIRTLRSVLSVSVLKRLDFTYIYRPENNEHKLTKLQNKQTISQKPKFHCHEK